MPGTVRSLSTQAAEEEKDKPTTVTTDEGEGAYHTIIKNVERGRGPVDKREFQAETRKLLDIVAKSLYSEKEVRPYCYIILLTIKDEVFVLYLKV